MTIQRIAFISLLTLFIIPVLFAQEKELEIDIKSHNAAVKLANEGNMHLKAKRYEAAIPLFVQSIAKDSTMKDTYEMAYYASMYLGKLVPEVVALIEKGERLYPKDHSFPFYLADMYRIDGNYKYAISGYTKAINLAKEQTGDSLLLHTYFFNRGTVCIKMKKYQAAIDDYKVCLKYNPDNPFTNLNMGNCFHNLGQEEKARIYWRKAAALGNEAAKQYLDLSSKLKK